MSNNSHQRPVIHFLDYRFDQQNQNLPHTNHNPSHDQNQNVQQGLYTKPLIQHRQRKRTSVLAWCMAAVCTVLWVAVILLGLTVLIVYLVYRPRSPQFDIAAASLNAGYIDTGNLLNADITLLANVINPNRKVNIYFSSLQLDMYFQGIMIGTQVIDAFYEPRQMEALRNLKMITSAVQLPLQVAQEWGNGTQPGGGGVTLHLSGRFRTRWLFGRWLRFTKWLHPSCEILVGPPPNGVLLKKQC
ncbi:Protein YLS9 [Carex littledalei]|uniref:Protein YLS9 n=1 Tax=Carex littledalei TaxID=544730 RepID=A0A833RK80_9POAL|nr:Protein YLS9 [Carex littledalei]